MNWYFMFISGMVLGLEVLEDEESTLFSIDLLICRFIIEIHK
jgi:hypothetical protein